VEVGPENSESIGGGIASCSMDYRHSNLPDIWPVHWPKTNACKDKSFYQEAENVPVEVADRRNLKRALKD
jgi:hypothetical protein